MARIRRRRGAAVVVAAALLLGLTATDAVTASGAIPLSSVTSMTPTRAINDRERLWADGCIGYEATTVPRHCAYGVLTSTKVVALVGDSHASMLFPAVERIAKAQGWRLEVFAKVSCEFVDMRLWNRVLGRVYTECATWNANVVRRVASLRPRLTLVVNSHLILQPAYAVDNTIARKGAALAREINKLYGRVAVIVDSPMSAWNVPLCLTAHRADIRPCSTSRTTALYGSLGAIERTAVAATGDSLVNLTAAICPVWPCSAVRNRAIIFRDHSHLTATFARTLAPALSAKILPLVP